MSVIALVFLFLLGHALSGPVRRNCGKEECYNAVNECGITYGGCWTECTGGPTEMPTFTAPLCTLSIDAGDPTRSTDTVTVVPSSTDSPAKSLITPPPSVVTTTIPSLSKTTSCAALWLCVDYLAVCGELTQMYGGCYDVCTSSPPVTSPPCSLSSNTTKTGSATTTPSPNPGAAYTENPATDSVTPATDDSKAMVMAEMPNTDAPAPEPAAPAPAAEFRLANANAEDSAASPATEASAPVEAPANLRGAAIAKMQADKLRKPNTDNVPCWDSDLCKEVQLGIPSPVSSQSTTAPSAAPTLEPSSEPASSPPAGASTGTSTGTPAEASV
ncbi:hypothetical protein SVAN01_06714 [Stagonosporopsis vannaccii]|nr:hypothetical protein SVAN01_06714 [Stagonosporopsis vannaccii]